MNPWVYLILAGIFEVAFTTSMRLSDGFRRWEYVIVFAICAICSFGLITLATRSISLGIAYAVWTGIGAAGTLIVSRLVFKDSFTLIQMGFVILIIISVVGLKYSHTPENISSRSESNKVRVDS
ncbi:MAG: multidrug efflux SMR transporter [Verrucomicrobiota bacterium]